MLFRSALFALTAIGSATVRRCHSTFAQWRLAGATPIQVRVSALSVAGLASAIGSAAGSLASLPLSSALVPAFDALAAEGFSGGLGSFEPPAFDVGALAAPLAFAVSWPTCMAGAILPALRTGRVAPVDFLRKTGADTGRSRAGTAANDWIFHPLILFILLHYFQFLLHILIYAPRFELVTFTTTDRKSVV